MNKCFECEHMRQIEASSVKGKDTIWHTTCVKDAGRLITPSTPCCKEFKLKTKINNNSRPPIA